MIQGIIPRRMMTQITGLQDGQDGSVLTDAAVVNPAGQPLADRFTALPARGDSTARSGNNAYGLRPLRRLGQPCPQKGHERIRPALAAGPNGPFPGHIAQLRTPPAGSRAVPIGSDEYIDVNNSCFAGFMY
jgi:hypothetical protein